MTARKPAAPPGLGTRAARLWREVVVDFDLRVDELRLLEDACREVDVIERLDVAVREGGLLVAGSMGQSRPNPLLGELRAHRLVLARLLAQVGFPVVDDDERAGVEQRSAKARKAARARWGQGGMGRGAASA